MHYIQKQGVWGKPLENLENLHSVRLNLRTLLVVLPQCVGESKKKQELLPSRQIVYSTQQVVYLAHANMQINH